MSAGPGAQMHGDVISEDMSCAEVVHVLALRGIQLAADNGLQFRAAGAGPSAGDRQALAARRAELMAFLRLRAAARQRPRIELANCPPVPSHFQAVWYRISSASPEGRDVIPLIVPLRAAGGVRPEAAVRLLVARHDALRYRFELSGHGLEARLNNADELAIETESLPGPANDPHSQRALQNSIREFLARGIPVQSRWLLQVKVARAKDGSGALMLLVHHIVADGTSMEIVRRELDALIGAPSIESVLLRPAVPFSSYAAWERRWFSGDYAASLAGWWSQWLAGVPALSAPAQRGQPLRWVPGHRIAYPFSLDADATAALRQRCIELGAGTPLYLLLALACLALQDWCGQDRFAMLVTADGRATPATMELLNTVGLLMHTDAVAATIPADRSLRTLIRRLTVEHQCARELHFPSNREHAGIREQEFHHRIGVVANFMRVAMSDKQPDTLGVPVEAADAEEASAPAVSHSMGHCPVPLHPVYLRFTLSEQRLVGSFEFNETLIDRGAQQQITRNFLRRLRSCQRD